MGATRAYESDIYPNDFVSVTPTGTHDTYVGDVIATLTSNGVLNGYEVRLWGSDGPHNTTHRFTPDEVTIHTEGRLSVMDDISQQKYNHR